jgi:hypothetical protein
MAEAIKKAAAKKAVPAARRATDKRTVGTAKNPKKVTAPSSSAYKAPKPAQVVKGKAGRPKKVT